MRSEALPCSVPNCGRYATCRGWCNIHYQRWYRHGVATAGRTTLTGEPLAFLEAATSYTGNDCLIWPFSTHIILGYAQIHLNGRSLKPHRIICEQTHGPAPADKGDVAHSCGVRACINPGHLRWANDKENHADAVAHGTKGGGERSPAVRKLTAAQAREIRSLKGSETRASIAARFGIFKGTVTDIWIGKTWKDTG